MQACSECGHLSDDEANFCDQCGNRLHAEKPPPAIPVEPEPEDRPLESRPWVWVVGAVALLVAIGAAAALVFNDPESEPAEVEPTAGATPTEPTGPAATATPDPDEVLGTRGTTRIRLSVSNCPNCEITAVPSDGSASQVATVASDAVEFAVATPSTLGLGFSVRHPDGFGENGGPNAVVLAPAGVAAGTPVTVSDLLEAEGISVCWAGTTAEEHTIPVNVEVYEDGTLPGGLRAWANPAEPVTPAAPTTTGFGSASAAALLSCAPVDES